MILRVLVPVLLIGGLLVGVFVWYRRKMESMKPGAAPAPSGVRLTAGQLRELPPVWRVVPEIGDGRLGDIDHVAIGPPGVVAIRTIIGDRPAATQIDDSAEAVARAAIARGEVDDLVSAVGDRCDRIATVWWGTPDADAPAAVETSPGAYAVEGQRLASWLAWLPPTDATPARIDLSWQAVTTGIGRPDPLG